VPGEPDFYIYLSPAEKAGAGNDNPRWNGKWVAREVLADGFRASAEKCRHLGEREKLTVLHAWSRVSCEEHAA